MALSIPQSQQGCYWRCISLYLHVRNSFPRRLAFRSGMWPQLIKCLCARYMMYHASFCDVSVSIPNRGLRSLGDYLPCNFRFRVALQPTTQLVVPYCVLFFLLGKADFLLQVAVCTVSLSVGVGSSMPLRGYRADKLNTATLCLNRLLWPAVYTIPLSLYSYQWQLQPALGLVCNQVGRLPSCNLCKFE